MIWRLLIFEIVSLVVVVGVWFGAPYAGITSVLWRLVIIFALLVPPIILIVWNMMRDRRAARGLEAGIREQAKAQQERARPDRRQEVEVLRRLQRGGDRAEEVEDRRRRRRALRAALVHDHRPPRGGKEHRAALLGSQVPLRHRGS